MTSITDHFNKATKDDYAHHLAKKYFDAKTYNEETFFTKIKALETKSNQKIPLDSKRVNSWTPAHVAAIANNIEAMKFFKRNGFSINEKDAFNLTPYDYCKQYSHDKLIELLAPTQIVKELLEKWAVKLPEEAYEYQANTHDFGIEIKKLMFTAPTPSKYRNNDAIPQTVSLNKNLEKIAQKQGFEVKHTKGNFFPRDHFIQTPKGFKLPNCSENVKKMLPTMHSFSFCNGNPSTDLPSLLEIKAGGPLTTDPILLKLEHTLQFPDVKERELPFYLEGGNHYILSRGTERVFLAGKEFFHFALNELILSRFFKQEAPSKSTLSHLEIRNALKEMYEQGLLPQNKHFPKGTLDEDERAIVITEEILQAKLMGTQDKFQSDSLIKKAEELKILKPMNLTSNEVKSYHSTAANYLEQKKITKKFIADFFEVKEENVHFITQVSYHLDFFVHPGPKGSLFVQNYSMTKDFLYQIKQKAKELALSKKDEEQLEKYYQVACKLEKHLTPLQDKANEELKQAGFTLIPAPGIIYDDCPYEILFGLKPELKNINFLNGESGWSSKTNNYYWIVGGTAVGDRLGQVLMDGFKEFLQANQPGIEVHYVGYNPDQPNDFSEARRFLNDHSAGVHCMSLELETKSHTG